MKYLNVHLSLGWVNDERVASFELPEQWDHMTDEQQDALRDQLYLDAVGVLVQGWTTETDEPID